MPFDFYTLQAAQAFMLACAESGLDAGYPCPKSARVACHYTVFVAAQDVPSANLIAERIAWGL